MTEEMLLNGVEVCPISGRPLASDGLSAGFGIAGFAYVVGMTAWGVKTGAIAASAVALMCGGAVAGLAVVGGAAYLLSRDGCR